LRIGCWDEYLDLRDKREQENGVRKCIKRSFISEISSCHGGEYEVQNIMGCTAVFLIECRPAFQRYVLPPSSGR
jgi:hypothetical protein